MYWSCEKWISITCSQRERNVLNTIRRRKANCIGLILRRNCLIKHVIYGKLEGRIEVIRRWERRRKQLGDDIKVARGYWKLKEEALDRILWRIGFGRGCGPVVRCCRPAASSVHYTTSCKHSLALPRMGEIMARNRLSWLKLLINCYCCI